MHQFKFSLGQNVHLAFTEESGEVIARAEYSAAEDHYLLRYRAADGRAVEAWWGDSALEA